MDICLFFPTTAPPRPPSYTVSKWKSKASLIPLYFFLKLSNIHLRLCSIQLSLSRVRLCDSMDCSTPGLPVHHQFPELAQTHVHRVGDAIQTPHPLWSPYSPAFNLSQHQGLFQWVSSSHQVAKVLELQLQLQSFQWRFRTDFLWDWLVWSPCSPRDIGEWKNWLKTQLSKPVYPVLISVQSSCISRGITSLESSTLCVHIVGAAQNQGFLSYVRSTQPFLRKPLAHHNYVMNHF